jgi:hypothetical protein
LIKEKKIVKVKTFLTVKKTGVENVKRKLKIGREILLKEERMRVKAM